MRMHRHSWASADGHLRKRHLELAEPADATLCAYLRIRGYGLGSLQYREYLHILYRCITTVHV